jgi:hypothetical protein
MKKATWDDIEWCLNHGTLQDQDRETLEAFSLVTIPTSRNPVFHQRFNNAKEVIRDRIRQIDAQDKDAKAPKEKWHDHPMGKIFIGATSAIIGGLVMWVITQFFNHRFPFLK